MATSSVVTGEFSGQLASVVVERSDESALECACSVCGIRVIGGHRMKMHIGSKSCRERKDLNEQPARVIAALFHGQHIRVRGRRYFSLSGTGEPILHSVIQSLLARRLLLSSGPRKLVLSFRDTSWKV